MFSFGRASAVLLVFSGVSVVSSAQDFTFDDNGSRVAVADLGQPVLEYVYKAESTEAGDGSQTPELVNYFHPMHGLYGEVLTGDAPSNWSGAPGISWSWTRMGVEGRGVDLADGKHGMRVFERVTREEAKPDRAEFGLQNAWITKPDGQAQVVENISFVVRKVDRSQRTIDMFVTLRSVSTGKIYLEGSIPGSGLTFQLNSERKDWRIVGGQGEYEPSDHPYLSPWVVCSYRDDRRSTRSGLAVFQDSRNPGFSEANWLMETPDRLNMGVSASVKAELAPGQSLEFRYRFLLYHLGGSKVDMTAEYARFMSESMRRE